MRTMITSQTPTFIVCSHMLAMAALLTGCAQFKNVPGTSSVDSTSVANAAAFTESGVVPATPAGEEPPEAALTGVPVGWSVAGRGWKRYLVAQDRNEKRSGKASLRVTAEPGITLNWPNPWEPWSAVMQSIDAQPWHGKRIRLSAWLKTENVMLASIWLRVDGERTLQFDNMAGRFLTATTGWNRYDVVLDVPTATRMISFGTLLHGGGQIWADDFELHVVDSQIHSTNTRTPEELAKSPLRNFTPDHQQATHRRPVALPQASPRNLGFED